MCTRLFIRVDSWSLIEYITSLWFFFFTCDYVSLYLDELQYPSNLLFVVSFLAAQLDKIPFQQKDIDTIYNDEPDWSPFCVMSISSSCNMHI